MAHPDLAAWMDRNSDRLYLSVVTVAEVEDGISKAIREDATRKAALLGEWLETVLHLYGGRVLGVDISTARLAGRLSDHVRGQGHAPGFADLLIGATAQTHGCIVLTRNLKHFAPMGIAALDPYGTLP